MESADIGWTAVVAASFVPVVFGALRHSPLLPARARLRAARRADEALSGPGLTFASPG